MINTNSCVRKEALGWLKGYLDSLVKAALLGKIKDAACIDVGEHSFNVVLLKYLWRMTAVLGHSKSICLTVKWHLQWSQMGWLPLDRRHEWVIRLWPILSRVMTVSSRRHNDVCGLFLPSTGLIENSLFVGVLSHESCHSSMHSLDICRKKLSGGILLWVMTERIPSLAALSAISFPFILTWLGIQHRLTCLPISVSWV